MRKLQQMLEADNLETFAEVVYLNGKFYFLHCTLGYMEATAASISEMLQD